MSKMAIILIRFLGVAVAMMLTFLFIVSAFIYDATKHGFPLGFTSEPALIIVGYGLGATAMWTICLSLPRK